MRIAVGEGFITDLISQPLQSFILRYPGIDLEVQMAGANEAVGLLKEDAVDLALVYAPIEDEALTVHVDTRQPLDLIIPPQHRLASHRGAVSMTELRGEALALIHSSTGMGQLAVMVAQLEHMAGAPLFVRARKGLRLTEAGEATLVLEVRDSLTNALMGRALDRRETRRGAGMQMTTSVTNQTEFRALFRQWASIAAKGLEELKSHSPVPTDLKPGQKMTD